LHKKLKMIAANLQIKAVFNGGIQFEEKQKKATQV
jgi:hypothetical protein